MSVLRFGFIWQRLKYNEAVSFGGGSLTNSAKPHQTMLAHIYTYLKIEARVDIPTLIQVDNHQQGQLIG